MSFVFYPPITKNLDGNDGPQIVQGATYQVDFQILDSNNSPVNLSEWASSGILCEFRDKFKFDGGLTTNCPVPALSWPNGGTDGIIRMTIIPSHTMIANINHGGGTAVYDVYITHTATGYITRILGGGWSMDYDVTRIAAPVNGLCTTGW